MITIFCVLLMLVGVGVLLYPTVADYYFRWRAVKEIEKYNHAAEDAMADYTELWEAAEAYNRELAEKGEFSVTVSARYANYVAQFLNPLGNGMMGYVDIPKINIHIPIYQGTKEIALQAGAGFWVGTSLPTGGESTHTVLTAHNGLVRAKMFTDIDQMEIGDTFSLQILDRTLNYEVDQILVVEPDDFEPLKIVRGEDLVTLYTCTPYGINTHRLLVRGHRVDTVGDDSSASAAVLKTAARFTGWQLLLILAVLILLMLFVWRMLVRRRRKSEKVKEARKSAGDFKRERYPEDGK